METITKDILNYIGNKHTKVKLKDDFNGNYYSYITDTIYIAKNFSSKNKPVNAKEFDKEAAELIIICHECIHSIQSKVMHILNMILSNISIILTVISIILGLFWTSPLILKIVTCLVLCLGIVVRLVLEINAVNKSIKLAFAIIQNGIVRDISKQNIKVGNDFIEKYKCLEYGRMIIDKIIFLILVFAI